MQTLYLLMLSDDLGWRPPVVFTSEEALEDYYQASIAAEPDICDHVQTMEVAPEDFNPIHWSLRSGAV